VKPCKYDFSLPSSIKLNVHSCKYIIIGKKRVPHYWALRDFDKISGGTPDKEDCDYKTSYLPAANFPYLKRIKVDLGDYLYVCVSLRVSCMNTSL
jgi:hypothetical protein